MNDRNDRRGGNNRGRDDRRGARGSGDKSEYRGGRGRGDKPERRGGRGERDTPEWRRKRGDREAPEWRGKRGDRRDSRDDRQGAKPYGRGGTRGGGKSDRGGADREFTEAERLQHELRPVRAEHTDPDVPDEVQAKDLPNAARNELKTLQSETQERVARHLVMVAALIDDDPELAHQHAISASRRAGRIPVVRETLAATAYRTGDFALALRELRTHRRLSGSQGNIALMVEAERALGRPQKAIETGLEVDPRKLKPAQRAQLAVAMSGARLDLGQTQQALFELEVPELDPRRAFSYSPELFAAYAAVLHDLGRFDDAKLWQQRAERAEAALNDELASMDQLEVIEIAEEAPREEPAEGRASGEEDAD